MTEKTPLLDEDRIDMERLLDRYASADIYASDQWLDYIEDQLDLSVGVDPRREGGVDEAEWLSDNLLLLFVETQRHTDIGVLEFVAAMKEVEENIQTTAGVGLNRYADENGYDLQSGYLLEDMEDETDAS